ncbi:hypothetical protein ACMGG3_03795 [Enterobacter sp. BNK-18]|uniref:hypothetical protein n=1 Tax=Enterobacter sp. BNK-18 TaxID=3376155 RepID=UPI0039BFBDDB
MGFRPTQLLLCILFAFFTFNSLAISDETPRINTSSENNTCSIKINDELVDGYKCEFYRAPSVWSHSYLYEASKQIIIFIDSPMGNACDGGPLHVFSKTDDEKFKHLKTIDFCGGHYPSITSGPETFIIKVPSISIDGTDKKIPTEIWELNNDELVKRQGRGI